MGAYARDDVRTGNWRDFSDRPLYFRLSRNEEIIIIAGDTLVILFSWN